MQGTQLNEIYRKQYLKSVGKDETSNKRKREEAFECIDEWVEGQYESHNYEREFNEGKNKFRHISGKIRHEVETSVRRKVARNGAENTQEIKDRSEKRIEEELGTMEEYATGYAEERVVPRVPLGVLSSIRDLLENNI
jgi:hypothetical protein